MRDDGDGIEKTLSSLLRGEIAAAETYQQAIEKVAAGPVAGTLRAIQEEHGAAIRFLKEELVERGVEPPLTSGGWGAFAKAVEGVAQLIGSETAWSALREGERQGLHDYEEALGSQVLPPDCREFIEQRLVPGQRRHIATLEGLIGAH